MKKGFFQKNKIRLVIVTLIIDAICQLLNAYVLEVPPEVKASLLEVGLYVAAAISGIAIAAEAHIDAKAVNKGDSP